MEESPKAVSRLEEKAPAALIESPPPAARPFRQKKTWSAEDSKAFWKEKKLEKKSRKREANAKKKEEQQHEWELLSEAEKLEIREKAARVHEIRRAQEEHLEATCSQNLASAETPTLLFDLGFMSVMNDADCRSTVSQIKFSYSILKRSGFCMKPVITSFDAKHPALSGLDAFEGFRKFAFPMVADHWSSPSEDAKVAVPQLRDKSKLVYLTADTDTVLEALEPGTTYIVGAFVDHNSKKGLTRDVAASHGLRMARLPLVESIRVGNRCKVFTINHVADILVKFIEKRDWAAAFEAVLPTRRIQQCSSAASHADAADVPSDNDEGTRDKRPRSPTP